MMLRAQHWSPNEYEITKLHEETVRGTVEEVLQHFTKKPPKGELVMVVAGK